MKLAIIIALLLPTSIALAQPKPPIGPTPLPAIGAACPSGYQRSGGAFGGYRLLRLHCDPQVG